MRMRYIAPLAMAATAAAIGFAPHRRSRTNCHHEHGRCDNRPVAGQCADHRSAGRGCAAGRPAAVPILRVRGRPAVPPRRASLTVVECALRAGEITP